VARSPRDSERTRVAAWESVCGAVMLIAGLLLSRTGAGIVDVLGLALLFLGVGGLGHGVLYGLGLVNLPGASVDHKDDDDARQ
jgi:hypothetical protein